MNINKCKYYSDINRSIYNWYNIIEILPCGLNICQKTANMRDHKRVACTVCLKRCNPKLKVKRFVSVIRTFKSSVESDNT
jgi:hypothetical protein